MLHREKFNVLIQKLIPYIIVSIVVTLIWLQFFIDGKGFISFGNSVYPIDRVQIFGLLKEYSIFGYNPFAYGGAILPGTNAFPEFITNFVNALYLVFLNSFLNAEYSLKIYIVSLNIFMAFSFLLLLNAITERKIASISATLFLVINPFQIQIIAYGDTGQLEQLGFMFLSLYFATSFLKSSKQGDLNIILSAVFLLLVYPFFQAFILGGILIVALILLKFRTIVRGKFSRDQLRSLAIMVVLIPSAFYILWPFLFGGNNLLPNSTFAQTFSNFAYYSESFWRVLLLQGYTPFVSSIYLNQFVGEMFSGVWIILFDSFLFILLILVPLLSRKPPTALISLAIIVFSLLGSGAKSPIALVNDFFYLHLPGYQTLNTSYYWDWVLIAPLYSIQLALGVNWFISSLKGSNKSYPSSKHSKLKRVTKMSAIVIVLSLLVVSFAPFMSQGYYENGYVQTVNLPKDYYSIPTNIKSISGSSYTGVAFFNPDNLLYLGNNSENGFNSPFFNMMPAKTYGLPNYAAPPFNSSYYLYWVYSLFYHNQTTELGDLLSVLGIQYFVVLYKTNSLSGYGQFMPWSQNVNASKLMQYQTGVQRVYTSPNYSIYRNLFYGGQASSASKLSIVLGNYTSMSEMANSGVNLSTLASIYYPELRNINLDAILPYLGTVLYQNGQIYSLIYADQNETEVNLVKAVANSGTDIQTKWINSLRLIGGGHTSPSIVPGIATDGRNTVNYTLNADVSGHYSVWIRALNGPSGGYINITGGNSSFRLDTRINTTASNLSYEYKWYRIEMNLQKGGNLINITSSNNYNSISAIFYGEKGQFSSFLNNTINKFRNSGIAVEPLHNITKLGFIESEEQSNLTLKFSGFSFSSAGNITIIRNSYYSTFTPINSNSVLIPTYNGLNFVVVNHKPTEILYYPISFYVMSLIVPSTFLAVSTLLALIWRKSS